MKTEVKNRFSTLRGLFGVLCGVLVVTANIEIVNASSTTDDLKAYLGITVEKHDESKLFTSDYIEDDENTSENKKDEQSEEDEETSPIELAKTELGILNVSLEQLLKGDATGFEIMAKISEVRDKKHEISMLGYNIQGTDITDDYSNNDNLIQYNPANDIKSRWYNIGSIGSNLKGVVDPMQIYKPYGYLTEQVDGKYTPVADKNNSLWLKADNNTEVNCLFNGIVYSVEAESDNGLYSICISHGQDVYTIYRHVKTKGSLHKGDAVKQYQILGTVGSASDDEQSHLELQVVIEGKYINPLTLFGTSGRKLYNNYLSNYSDRYYVEVGEYSYYVEEMSVENPNK